LPFKPLIGIFGLSQFIQVQSKLQTSISRPDFTLIPDERLFCAQRFGSAAA
jgi:hypothetical protein